MGDLISRAKALHAITSYNGVVDKSVAKRLLIQLLSAQPEIIYCRDCIHYRYADNSIPQEHRYTCDLDGDRWKPTDFCSFAEREING